MTKLYTEMANIYHQMYASIFDYKKDFREFDSILKKHGAKRVLELGCGAGNLAKYFRAAGYDYTGADNSREMLRIAKKENHDVLFLRIDMRRFSVRRKFDAVLIGGRSFTYMTRNKDALDTLRCVQRALRPDGLLVFDNFDAAKILPGLKPMRERVRSGDTTFTRNSKLSPNLETGWTWNWDAVYVIDDGMKKKTVRDRSVLRAFTRDELRLFLSLTGFEVVQIRHGPSTILTVARQN